ncbi:MAG: hypothetical protein ACLT38_00010 [Akkermansia sp.]
MSENKDDYAFKLIAPGMNGSEERSIARPMVYVPRKSEMGKRLFMLFKINEEMEHSPYRVLNANDEADMLRARVLLSRSKEPNRKGEYSFTLVRLLGKAGTAFLSRNKRKDWAGLLLCGGWGCVLPAVETGRGPSCGRLGRWGRKGGGHGVRRAA